MTMPAMEIVRERENRLLHRREYIVRIDHTGKPTPSRAELRGRLVHFLNAPQNTLIVKRIVQRFGRQDALAKVYVYENEEIMREIEDEKTLRLNGFAESEAAARFLIGMMIGTRV